MGILQRVKFVTRQYCGLLPAIWRSWRAPTYPPPTLEEVQEFMRHGVDGQPVPLNPTCVGIKRVSYSTDYEATLRTPEYIPGIPDKHWVRWE